MSPDDPMLPVAYRVEKVTKETRDTFTLVTRRVDRAPRHAFEPGQFSMLYVCAVGELPISISGDTADKHSDSNQAQDNADYQRTQVELGVRPLGRLHHVSLALIETTLHLIKQLLLVF